MADPAVAAALEQAAKRQQRLAELEAALPENEQWRSGVMLVNMMSLNF